MEGICEGRGGEGRGGLGTGVEWTVLPEPR